LSEDFAKDLREVASLLTDGKHVAKDALASELNPEVLVSP